MSGLSGDSNAAAQEDFPANARSPTTASADDLPVGSCVEWLLYVGTRL